MTVTIISYFVFLFITLRMEAPSIFVDHLCEIIIITAIIKSSPPPQGGRLGEAVVAAKSLPSVCALKSCYHNHHRMYSSYLGNFCDHYSSLLPVLPYNDGRKKLTFNT